MSTVIHHETRVTEFVQYVSEMVAWPRNAHTSITIDYYFNDHLGAPILQTDATGAVIWRVERDPYGERYATRVGAERHQPLGLPGQEYDASSDRQYNIFRWYRANWGRYTQADPIGLQAGVNLYGYVEGNPVNFVDRLGLIRQSELDQMDCCQLLQEIEKSRKELLRLRKNQNDPVKRRAQSAYQYAKNYVGHRTRWRNESSRLRDLLDEFDDKNCDPPGLPRQVRKLADDRYPDFPWDEFMNQWGEGANETMKEINEWMNDPRNWLGLLGGRAGGRRVPAGVRP